MDLESDFRNLSKDVVKVERQIGQMLLTLEGESGKGGIVGDLRVLQQNQMRLIANQEATSNLIRVGFWVMGAASSLAIFVSLTALVISIFALLK